MVHPVFGFVLVVLVAAGAVAQTSAVPGNDSNASALLDKHAALSAQLAQNVYRRPLFLESTESANKVSGSAYAVLDSPLSTVSAAFKMPSSMVRCADPASQHQILSY